MHQGFAVGLHGQATQGVVSLLQRMTLSPESSVAQARATRLERIAATGCIRAASGAGSISTTSCGRPIRTTRTRLVAKTPSRCGLGSLLTWSVVTTHSHHLLGWRRGFGHSRWLSCGFSGVLYGGIRRDFSMGNFGRFRSTRFGGGCFSCSCCFSSWCWCRCRGCCRRWGRCSCSPLRHIVQMLYGLANEACIAASNGFFQRLRSL